MAQRTLSLQCNGSNPEIGNYINPGYHEWNSMSENPKKIQCLRKEDVRQAKKGKGREEGDRGTERRSLRGQQKKKTLK